MGINTLWKALRDADLVHLLEASPLRADRCFTCSMFIGVFNQMFWALTGCGCILMDPRIVTCGHAWLVVLLTQGSRDAEEIVRQVQGKAVAIDLSIWMFEASLSAVAAP